ncbi:Scr1 family TA system antitoxin-like transcriptional regulator [Streptomyces sp. PRh5]|nr:Scr1 family TA system antitoxin-like transcriptional regulator [Streptomyces sp. PRh5]
MERFPARGSRSTAEAELARYRAVVDRMETTALNPDESRDFIHNIVRTM